MRSRDHRTIVGRPAATIALAAAIAPFVMAAALPASGGGVPGLSCPLRSATGLPCPLCGATRAFVLAVHGDGAWVRHGAPWVLLAAVVAAIAAITVLTGRPLALPRTRWPAAAGGVGVAWAWAIAHAGTIT